jgi:hypothetical protein
MDGYMKTLRSNVTRSLVGFRSASVRARPRGFVIGELLVAVLLLAVAVSSLAALMYSVSHRTSEPEKTECVAKGVGNSKCVAQPPVPGASKLLRSSGKGTCEGLTGAPARDCVDAAIARGGETVLVSKTDSASLAMIAKKEKPKQIRTDRGFIR